jgi:hypothetical protein
MAMIIGMDIGVFLAWILTILSAIVCILYGVYDQFIKKTSEEKKKKSKQTKKKTSETREE